jgi:hypothetical protein
MAIVDPIRILLPVIIRLFPELAGIRLVRGRIIPLKEVSPMNEAEALRALNKKLQTKKRQGFNDNSHVIKLETLRKILDEVLGSGNQLVKDASKIAVALVTGHPGEPILQDSSDKVMERCRDECLKQTAARRRITYRYAKREI